eukprot:gene1570-12695_t
MEESENNKKKQKSTLEILCIKMICVDMEEYEKDDFYIKTLPNCLKQELLHHLCKTKSMTFDLLEQFKESPITRLNLSFCGRVSNEWISIIRQMKLEHLNLSHCLISNEGINKFRRTKRDEKNLKKTTNQSPSTSPVITGDTTWTQSHLPLIQYPITNSLTNLNLSYNGIIDENSIETISKYFKNLKMLSIEGCLNINNNSLKQIGKRLTNLIGLNLKGCEKITSKGIKDLIPLLNLEVLNLSQCSKLDSNINKYLIEFRKLVYLNLKWNEKINSLKGIRELKELRTLDISGLIQLRDHSFLRNLKNLTSLNISKTNLNQNGIDSSFENLINLKSIDFSFCSISNENLILILKNLKELKDLNLTKTLIEDDLLDFLSNEKCFNELKSLSISSCKYITDESFKHFESSNFQNLNYLNISFLKHISIGFQFLESLKLTILDLKGSISNENLKYFQNLFKNQQNSIEALYLNFNFLDEYFCEQISKLRFLRNLDLSNTNINDNMMINFHQLTHLKNLSLSSCENLTDDGILKFKFNSELEYFDLSNTRVTDESMKLFSNTLSRVYNLNLMGCRNMKDSSMKYLKKFEFLNCLNIYDIIISDVGIQYLSEIKRLATLKIGIFENLITENGFDMFHEDFPNLVYLRTKLIVEKRK